MSGDFWSVISQKKNYNGKNILTVKEKFDLSDFRVWVEENLVTQLFFAKNAINLRFCLNNIDLLKLRCTAVGREKNERDRERRLRMMSRLLLTTSSSFTHKGGHLNYLCCLIKSLNAYRQWFPALRAYEMIIVCGTI